jgi:hypothetical protein
MVIIAIYEQKNPTITSAIIFAVQSFEKCFLAFCVSCVSNAKISTSNSFMRASNSSSAFLISASCSGVAD